MLSAIDKYYVSPDFINSTHGSLGCITCHGGNNVLDKEKAHFEMVSAPSSDINGICAQCHVNVTTTFAHSLHYNITGIRNALINFSHPGALDDPKKGLGEIFQLNCLKCHATCGQCHVSRPVAYSGGLMNQHEFFKTPPMDQTCYGCHGARNAGEFMGLVGFSGDVHYEMGMTCMDCHSTDNFHGTGIAYANMWEKPVLPSCLDCHLDQAPGKSELEIHNIHGDLLSCQVCHAQANNNCFDCHASIPEDRSKAVGTSQTRIMFRIGYNPIQSEERPWKYVTLRHIPTTANSFEEAGENLLLNYDQIPNWKFSPTHNIQRNTFQNETCNSCHGNERIFLREQDLRENDSKANWDLIPKIPRPIN